MSVFDHAHTQRTNTFRRKALWATWNINSTVHTQVKHTHSHSVKSQTNAKPGHRKLEWWNRTFCYSKNTYEGTCGWEHHAHFLFTYTPAQICGCTQTHIDTLQAEVTQVHTPAGTHTHRPVSTETNIMQSGVTDFGSWAQFEWLLFFFYRVRGWRWSKMNSQTGMGVCVCMRVCRVQESYALLVTRVSFIMSDNINHKADGIKQIWTLW